MFRDRLRLHLSHPLLQYDVADSSFQALEQRKLHRCLEKAEEKPLFFLILNMQIDNPQCRIVII